MDLFSCGDCSSTFATIIEVYEHITIHSLIGFVFDNVHKIAYPKRDVASTYTQTDDSESTGEMAGSIDEYEAQEWGKDTCNSINSNEPSIENDSCQITDHKYHQSVDKQPVIVLKTMKLNRKALTKCKIDKSSLVTGGSHVPELHKAVSSPVDSTGRRAKHKCNICGAVLSSRANLEGHRNAHLGVTPYMCEVCGNSFSSKKILNHHVLDTHHSERQFCCTKCEATFTHETKLARHVNSVHAKRSYDIVCTICQKAYASKYDLQRHLKTHEIGQHACDLCHKVFKMRSYLLQHKKSHSKTFMCQFCGKTFSNCASLSRHRKTHEKNRAHTCHICGRGFIQKTPYWSHMHKHHDLTKVQVIEMFPEKHLTKNVLFNNKNDKSPLSDS